MGEGGNREGVRRGRDGGGAGRSIGACTLHKDTRSGPQQLAPSSLPRAPRSPPEPSHSVQTEPSRPQPAGPSTALCLEPPWLTGSALYPWPRGGGARTRRPLRPALGPPAAPAARTPFLAGPDLPPRRPRELSPRWGPHHPGPGSATEVSLGRGPGRGSRGWPRGAPTADNARAARGRSGAGSASEPPRPAWVSIQPGPGAALARTDPRPAVRAARGGGRLRVRAGRGDRAGALRSRAGLRGASGGLRKRACRLLLEEWVGEGPGLRSTSFLA